MNDFPFFSRRELRVKTTARLRRSGVWESACLRWVVILVSSQLVTWATRNQVNLDPGSPLVTTFEKSTHNQSLGYELTRAFQGEKSTHNQGKFLCSSSTKYYSVFVGFFLFFYKIWQNRSIHGFLTRTLIQIIKKINTVNMFYLCIFQYENKQKQ